MFANLFGLCNIWFIKKILGNFLTPHDFERGYVELYNLFEKKYGDPCSLQMAV